MKSLIILLSFGLISCLAKKKLGSAEEINNPGFEKIFPLALRGELFEVFKILDSINDNDLNAQELKLKSRYYARFINEDERYGYSTQDPAIIEFVDSFHGYWKSIMLEKLSVAEADSLFKEWMSQFFYTEKYESENISVDSIKQDLYRYSNEFLNDRGYFSNAFGKTGHIYDLFLWKRDDVIDYQIGLIDDSVKVIVHLMSDFISTGWSHYSTFGKNYASGWATRDALFCVVSAYDLDSENFQISYLTHEGQHFLDYGKYPNLQQKDLEYRAKLVELVKSKDTTFEIIGKFIRHASANSNNAHAFANYCVVRDLSEAIFAKNYVTEKSDWLSIDSDRIKEHSKMLYDQHSVQLDSIGNNIVTEYIH